MKHASLAAALVLAIHAAPSLAAGAGPDAAPPSEVAAIADEPLETRQTLVEMARFTPESGLPAGQSLVAVKLQVLLDRANASPGVIDGYDGENSAKAIRTFEKMKGLPTDGVLDDEVWAALQRDGQPVMQIYTITEKDLDRPFKPLPHDYAELAKLDWLGYTSPAELFAERFHMDIELLQALNKGARFDHVGERLLVAQPEGEHPAGKVVRMTANRTEAELYTYDADGRLVTAYPATIGSEATPSPSGTVHVNAIAIEPAYYYKPDENFQQGDNDKQLKIPPGPNNPVGLVWIDLSKPTYGIHGTPEPAKIDKTFSHGCVRLTNWDAKELAGLVDPGATVEFVQ